MSIFQSLIDTYNANEQMAGKVMTKVFYNEKSVEYMLLPIAHTTQTAHIEVIVDLNGELIDAYAIDKKSTVLPFTEESGSRAGKVFRPHVLHDKLVYTAGDYEKYTGEKEKGEAFSKYREQLKEWVDSPYSDPKIEAIYRYVTKGRLIEDLVSREVLFVDEQGQLLKKWEEHRGDKPLIFKTLTNDQSSAFVRFNVHVPNEVIQDVWQDQSLFEKYTTYYLSKARTEEVCFISGEVRPTAQSHPNKLRNSGDKAKIISANDKSGFTYRGRFATPGEALTISYEASQKMHNALKWLIEKQGYQVDGRVFLLWGSHVDEPIPSPNSNDWYYSMLGEDFEIEQNKKVGDFTEEDLAHNYQKLLTGCFTHKTIRDAEKEQIHIAEIDAATPGRLAIINYRNMELGDYLKKLLQWQERTMWYKTIPVKDSKEKRTVLSGFSLREIANAAYSPRPDAKMVKEATTRLYECVLNGSKVPRDLVRLLFNRCNLPQAYEPAEYERLLQVSCGVFKDYFREEQYTVKLQTKNQNRSYLFGRLLAIADVFESGMLKDSGVNRPTNARRYTTTFVNKPASTWMTILKQLDPYFSKAAVSNNFSAMTKNDIVQKQIGEIIALFEEGDFVNKPLDEQYVLGYYTQRNYMYTKKEEKENVISE